MRGREARMRYAPDIGRSDVPDIGGFLGDTLGPAVNSAFDSAMKAFWEGALTLLGGAFEIADQISVFSLSTTAGPLGAVWPTMLWVSGMIALGLFFVQLTSAALRGGRGFFRTVTGPVQYGFALGLTGTTVGLLLTAADGLSLGILHKGLDAANFGEAMHATGLMQVTVDIAKPIVLGLLAWWGLLPVAIGYILEMLFRQAAILTLVAAVPIAAAGLLADATRSWYWRTVRWLIAAIALKPALALTLVLGFGTFSGARGLKELLVGCGMLIISLFSPIVLFRLLAFVDPATEPGAAFHDWAENVGLSPRSLVPVSSSGEESLEEAHTGRFDDQHDAHGEDHRIPDDTSVSEATGETQSDETEPFGSQEDESRSDAPEPANRGSIVAGPNWRNSGSDGTAAAGGEAAETAVIV